jgi:hypothetical protein
MPGRSGEPPVVKGSATPLIRITTKVFLRKSIPIYEIGGPEPVHIQVSMAEKRVLIAIADHGDQGPARRVLWL